MSRVCPEIITLQLGHYASHVGTHWWNIQESSFVYDPTVEVEIDHGVLFREGQSPKGETTFTPRLLVADLRGSLGGLRRRGRLYGSDPTPSGKQEGSLWQGETERHQQPALPPAPPRDRRNSGERDKEDDDEKDVCQVDERGDMNTATGGGDATSADDSRTDGVKVWSDLLRTHLHPWSVHLLPEPVHGSTDQPFDVFNFGEDQYRREEFRDEFEDRLRAFAEECDHLVGFHVLADGGDGFGGVAAGALSHIADEYPRRSAMMLPIQVYPTSALTLPQAVHRTVNTVLTLDVGVEHSDLCVPLSVQTGWTAPLRSPAHRVFSHFQYRPEVAYESSALLAAALDTVSLPWRCKMSPLSLWDVTASLNGHSRRLASLAAALPLGVGADDDLATWLSAGKLRLTGLTPCVSDERAQVWSACGVLRGFGNRTSGRDRRSPDVGEVWREEVCRRAGDRCHPLVSHLREPLTTHPPFPGGFSPTVDRAGRIRPHTVNRQGVVSTPAAVAMETSEAVGSSVTQLLATAARFNINKFHRFSAAGLQSDDFTEVVERLKNLAQCYSPES